MYFTCGPSFYVFRRSCKRSRPESHARSGPGGWRHESCDSGKNGVASEGKECDSRKNGIASEGEEGKGKEKKRKEKKRKRNEKKRIRLFVGLGADCWEVAVLFTFSYIKTRRCDLLWFAFLFFFLVILSPHSHFPLVL